VTAAPDFLALEESKEQRDLRVAMAKEFAQLYVAAFVHNPSGAKLLAHWDQTLLRKRVPVNAPHTEYAAVEAVRDFVAKIQEQINLASTFEGLNLK
jgi:hypothetical protein